MVAKPNAAPTVIRFIRIENVAMTTLRNTTSSSRNATIRMMRDGVGGTVDEHVGEVVVLTRRAADLRVRHRCVELAAQVLDHVGGGRFVDLRCRG